MEGIVGLGYSIWRNKPVGSILITSILVNLITQSLLWVVLSIFFHNYLVTLFIAEIIIWLVEALLFYRIHSNKLSFGESLMLSLIMNLSSFVLGWFLPT
jgi:hypothetical protein